MKLTNPYEKLTPSDEHRTSFVTSHETFVFLLGLHGRKGTFQATVNHMLDCLVKHLKENGITTYDPDTYERVVNSVSFNEPRSTLTKQGGQPSRPERDEARPALETANRNDGRGASNVARETTGDPLVTPDAGQPSGKNRTPRKRTTKTKA